MTSTEKSLFRMTPTESDSPQRTPVSIPRQELCSLLDAVAPFFDAVESHPLYAELASLDRLRRFMQYHVFAVWDFMCLLKALQQHLTHTTVPWLPVGDPRTRRLINEIVLGEESDELSDGRILSHFELYLEAMNEAGADVSAVMVFEQQLRQGEPVPEALRKAQVPAAAQDHVLHTIDVVEQGKAHVIAAAFTIGREKLIPPMFLKIVRTLAEVHPRKLDTFGLYLERHIELDRREHGPLATQMLELLCGCQRTRWEEATRAAISALEVRMHLWDAVLEEVAAR